MPPTLMDGMLERFTEKAASPFGEKYKKSKAMTNKLVMYILVMCLHIDDVRVMHYLC